MLVLFCLLLEQCLFSFAFFCFFSEGLCQETKQLLPSTSKKKGKAGGKGGQVKEEEPRASETQPVGIHLHFKRYIFDPHKKMVQA